MASTSLMLEAIQKKSQQQALDLVHHFFDLIYQRSESQTLGKIMILKGVCLYPARVKCATLAWHALQTLLGEQLNK
jgi:nitrogen fixation NifU-like protein